MRPRKQGQSPGKPAEIMEKDITSRLERRTGQANGIARQESKRMIGASIVKDFFTEEIDSNTALSQVTSLAMSDLYYLPPGTIPPMVMPYDPTASIPLALLAVSSDSLGEKELYDIAYFDLRNLLGAVPGVLARAVYGGKLQGDANLGQIADVVHLLDTFFSGAPAPKAIFGYSEGLNRDIFEDLKQNYFDEITDIRQAAYMLATVKHETADTWAPITEYGNRAYFDKYEPGTEI